MIDAYMLGDKLATTDMIADTLPNLLTGTKNFDGFSNVNVQDNKLTPLGNKASHSQTVWIQANKYLNVDKNEIYTLSASIYIVKGSENQIVGICRNAQGNGGCDNNNSPAVISNFQLNTWLPIYMTFKGLWATNLAFDFEFTQGEADFYIGDYKLVKGDKPSAWSPAPQDIALQSDLDDLKQQIAALKSKIGG